MSAAASVFHIARKNLQRLIYSPEDDILSNEEVVGWRLSFAAFGTASFFNGVALLCAIYFWVINRQTHVKKTKGSQAGYAQVDDDDYGENANDDADYDNSSIVSESGVNVVRESSIRKSRRRSEWRRLMSDVRRSSAWQSILNFEVEADDDVVPAPAPVAFDDDKGSFGNRDVRQGEKIPTEHPNIPSTFSADTRPRMGDIAAVASKIKIFSYLSQDALKLCLSDAKYIQLQEGDHLFERGKFDGSLYVVLDGSVRCRFHEYEVAGYDSEGEDGDKMLSFDSKSEEGSVVTPLLAMLEALVTYHRKGQENSIDTETTLKASSMADGVSCVAIEKTRLLVVPALCYSLVLEKYPADVHRVATTIVQRVQRVTLQVLVKRLGLQAELLNGNANFDRKVDLTSPEWVRLSSNLSRDGKNRESTWEALLIKDAAIVAAKDLGLSPDCAVTLHNGGANLISLDKGESLFSTGIPHHSAYLVLKGELEIGPDIVSLGSSRQPVFYRFGSVSAGAMVGILSCFSGDISIFSAKASSDVLLLRIPKNVFDDLLVAHPRAMVSCFERILSLLSPSVHLINWCSQWQFKQASEVIARVGEKCHSMYMILNGRVRASYDAPEGTTEEFGRGKCLGDVGGITKSRWSCKVFAIRNSELVLVPVNALEALIRRHPSAGLHFARTIATQVQTQLKSPSPSPSESIMPSYGLRLATIAVLPLSPEVDVGNFCSMMQSSLDKIAPTKLLNKSIARIALGEMVYKHNNAQHELKMTRFLGEVEEKNRLVVFQADQSYTWWSRLCIASADHILLLAPGHRAPTSAKAEKCLEWAYESMEVKIEVVVINDEDMPASKELDNWSESREWISGHHTVRTPFDCYLRDIDRLCRRLTGVSVGLVLGGGGARGLAHLGVIRALHEEGVTVDCVGGTSQGAFVGALYASTPDNLDLLMARSRLMAKRMSSPKEKILDLTLPLTSMFSGYRFNLGIIESLGANTRIQDLVLKFFCVSTDVQKKRLAIHNKGCLWKYVRASMSLTGYLPPISENGSLLVDGGYMSVVPTNIMKEQVGARTVISVDVSAEKQKDYYEYGEYLSGWWLLFNSLNPFQSTVSVPSMGDISDALRWVSSDQNMTKNIALADLHLRPPIAEYGTLEFDKFDEIVEKGYEYAKPLIQKFVEENPGISSMYRGSLDK